MLECGHMNTATWVVLVSWSAFLLVWVLYAPSSKPYVRINNVWGWGLRILVVVAIMLLLQLPGSRAWFGGLAALFSSPLVAPLGAALTVLGILLAVWARAAIGRNWGMPMTMKEEPELVTTGPYAAIRHPIYAGVLLAMLGSTLVVAYWVVAFAAFALYFLYSAHKEEKLMKEKFPEAYPAYQKRTKMLIPFIF